MSLCPISTITASWVRWTPSLPNSLAVKKVVKNFSLIFSSWQSLFNSVVLPLPLWPHRNTCIWCLERFKANDSFFNSGSVLGMYCSEAGSITRVGSKFCQTSSKVLAGVIVVKSDWLSAIWAFLPVSIFLVLHIWNNQHDSYHGGLLYSSQWWFMGPGLLPVSICDFFGLRWIWKGLVLYVWGKGFDKQPGNVENGLFPNDKSGP